MKYRLLGALCIVASASQLAEGIRWATLQLTVADTLSLVANLIFDIGALCGLWGLLALRATGSNRIFSVLSFLPVLGLVADMISVVQQLAHVASPDSSLSIAGGLLILLGWLMVGILTIAAKRLTGWRKFAPLMVGLAFPVAVLLRSITHVNGLISSIEGCTVALVGYAVYKGAIAVTRTATMTQPGMSRNA